MHMTCLTHDAPDLHGVHLAAAMQHMGVLMIFHQAHVMPIHQLQLYTSEFCAAGQVLRPALPPAIPPSAPQRRYKLSDPRLARHQQQLKPCPAPHHPHPADSQHHMAPRDGINLPLHHDANNCNSQAQHPHAGPEECGLPLQQHSLGPDQLAAHVQHHDPEAQMQPFDCDLVNSPAQMQHSGHGSEGKMLTQNADISPSSGRAQGSEAGSQGAPGLQEGVGETGLQQLSDDIKSAYSSNVEAPCKQALHAIYSACLCFQ